MDWEFSYDLIGRTTGIYASDGRYVGYTYDSFNRIKETTEYVGGMTLRTGYRYDDQSNHSYKTGLFRGIFLNNIRQLAYSYDDMGRRDKRVLMTATPFVTEYTYHNGAAAGTTSTVVKTVKNGNTTWEYAYDALGNIESIKKNGTLVERYTYDSLSQLKSVVRGSDTYAYSYDAGGNLLSVTKNGTVVQSYTYGNTAWKDLLTAYNGQTITYDAIGNPLTYRDGFSFTWSNVRQLTTATQGSNTYTYTYDASGLRTSKTVNGTRTDYYWLGDTLQAQKTGDEYLIFLYDENGTPYGFIQKNGSSETYYYYIFNLQGDVIGILNASGTEVVTYTYDAWGNPLSITGTLASTIGAANPLRYRGYYFDSETGFYYLQSRYYDPTTGRFINADSASNLAANSDFASYNLFAYCGNNPVSRQDSSGDAWETVWDIVSLSASVLEVVANPTDPWAWAGLVGDVIDVALPCVGGLGEAVDAAKTTVRVIQGVDDVVDTAKTFRHAADAVDDVRHATGAYVVLYESGQHYIGKGGFSRAITSAIGHMSDTNKVSAIVWAPASSSKSAFVTEFLLQTVYGAGKDVAENFNKIWSPGKNFSRLYSREKHMKFTTFNQLPLYVDDFFLRHLDILTQKDALVIHSPPDALVFSPVLPKSRKSLNEHVEYIQNNDIKKAIVVANNIQFLAECPSLEYLWVLPAMGSTDFDYSPAYKLPNLKWLRCDTRTGSNEDLVASVDYSQFRNLRRVSIHGGSEHQNIELADSIISLYFSKHPDAKNLQNCFPGTSLRNLSICEASITSLLGIESAKQLRRLDLSYNRKLTDISSLQYLSETLACLEIDACGKIKDFSVLKKLHNLEYLTLIGSNNLPDLSFLKNMPKLKYLYLSMNVEDGDLNLCEQLPYVKIQNRKHYSHKDKDLPKHYTDPNAAYSLNEM